MKIQISRGTARIKFITNRLNQFSTRSFCAQLERVDRLPVILDLRSVQFASPFGLVFLHSFIHRLVSLGAESVTVSTEGSFGNYLARMDFAKGFDGDPRMGFMPDLAHSSIRAQDLRHRLLEFRTFETANDDETEGITERIAGVIFEQRPDLRRLHEPIRLTLSEIIDNTQVHSGVPGGFLLAQTIAGRVYLALGDLGVGIPHRIRVPFPDLSDSECIGKALEEGISTRIGRGGMGLYELSGSVRAIHGARMAVRSGSGQVNVYPGRETPHDSCDVIGGTLVEVVF